MTIREKNAKWLKKRWKKFLQRQKQKEVRCNDADRCNGNYHHGNIGIPCDIVRIIDDYLATGTSYCGDVEVK